MKIKAMSKKPELIKFGELKPGDVIRFGDAYYMIIPEYYGKNTVYLGNVYNDTKLGHCKGKLIQFDYDCSVFWCDEAELIVRKFELKDKE